MQRVLHFLDFRSRWWLEQGSRRDNVAPELKEGLAAYAAKQHDLLQRMAKRFAQLWYPLLIGNNLAAEWPSHLIPTLEVPPNPQPSHPVIDTDEVEFVDDFFD
jgi:hypothetical protein